jgi:hypothetical protein
MLNSLGEWYPRNTMLVLDCIPFKELILTNSILLWQFHFDFQRGPVLRLLPGMKAKVVFVRRTRFLCVTILCVKLMP